MAKSKAELRNELKRALVERGVDPELAAAKAERTSFQIDPATGEIKTIGLWIEAPISTVGELADEIVKRREADLEEAGPERGPEGNRFDQIRARAKAERETQQERKERADRLYSAGGHS